MKDLPGVVAHYDALTAPEGAAHLPGHDTVALLGGRGTEDRLTLVVWR